MKINSLNNKANFKGRVQMPPEKFYTKIIDGMDFIEREKTLKRLIDNEEKNKPVVKKKILERAEEFFSKKSKINEVVKTKTLVDFWNESLTNMKNKVIAELPNEYVLRCRKSNLGKEFMTFSLTKGQEYIYGVTASIREPKFPEKQIIKMVDKINEPNSRWQK